MKHFSPANLRNLAVSGGRWAYGSCSGSPSPGVAGMGLKSRCGAGEAGLLSVSLMVWNEDNRPILLWELRDLFDRGLLSSVLPACTKKKASTVGCSTRTACGSFVSARALRHALRLLHKSSSSSCTLRDCSMNWAWWSESRGLVLSCTCAVEVEPDWVWVCAWDEELELDCSCTDCGCGCGCG